MSSINLLPNNIKAEIEQTKKNKKTVGYLLKSIAITLLIVAASALTFIYQKNILLEFKRDVDEKTKASQNFGDLESRAASFSERINTITKILKDINHWTGVLEEIKKITPSDASLSTVSIDADKTSRGKITGFAKTKNIVATLRSAMENSDKFDYVDIESSNIVVNPESGKEVENFVITFSLSREALNE
ncbi:MAG: PilN domain-containing protein [Patescibacteria group bacterium]|nr:PilN domain-containing protein [Patescibacteria group bacterium]